MTQLLEEKRIHLSNFRLFEKESNGDANVPWLDELRKAFSTNYLKMILAAGRPAFEEATGVQCDPAWLEIDDFDTSVLYGLRRDAEGVPSGKPATKSQPVQCEVLGAFHLLLRQAGAIQTSEG